VDPPVLEQGSVERPADQIQADLPLERRSRGLWVGTAAAAPRCAQRGGQPHKRALLDPDRRQAPQQRKRHRIARQDLRDASIEDLLEQRRRPRSKAVLEPLGSAGHA
jgi:hypothetical protein